MASPDSEDLGTFPSMTLPWIPAEMGLIPGPILPGWASACYYLWKPSPWFLLGPVASSADIGMQSTLEGPDAPSRKASGCTFMADETHKEAYLYSWELCPLSFVLLPTDVNHLKAFEDLTLLKARSKPLHIGLWWISRVLPLLCDRDISRSGREMCISEAFLI